MRDATVLNGIERNNENRANVVTYGDIEKWAESFMDRGAESDSGVKVTRKTAYYAPAVWQASSMITGDLAKIPFNHYRRNDDDTHEIEKNRLHRMVRRRPNGEEHAFGFWRYWFGCGLALGGGFIHIKRNGRGEPMELTALDPDQCKVERIAGSLWVNYETVVDNRPRRIAIPYDDVLHLKGLCLDSSIAGARLVYYARSTIGLLLARQRYGSKFFKNGAKQSGFLHLNPGTTRENQENAKKAFDKSAADEKKWHSVEVVRDGHKFVPTSIDPRAGQMVEQGEAAVREVCRYFNLAPSRLGLSDSVSYNSKAEDNQSYLDTTLSPWLEEAAAEANLKLLSERQQEADSHFFEHNVRAFLKMNALDEMTIQCMGIDHGLYSPNRVLRIRNEPKRDDGKGDDYKDVNAVKPSGGFDKGGSTPPRGKGDTPTQLDKKSDPKDRTRRIRATFELASLARDKSAKGHRAFGEFLKVRLNKFDDIPLRRALAEADRFPLESLASEVERICGECEESILET